MVVVVGILVFNNVEVLDFCGPFEVFSSSNENKKHFQVHLVANSSEPTVTVGGMRVLPDVTSYADCPPLDVILVPGGFGSRAMAKDTATLDFVKQQAQTAQVVASVCTGALVLGAAGLLKGKTATTHWELLDLLEQSVPECNVTRDKLWIQDGKVWTSAGISAGIDMSLRLVEHIQGSDLAKEVAKYMEYTFPEADQRRSK